MRDSGYSLLIVSSIPFYLGGGNQYTIDGWALDLEENRRCVNKLSVLAPRAETRADGLVAIGDTIEVVARDHVKDEQCLRKLVSAHDVVQVNGGRPYWQSRDALRVARMAKTLDKCLICGFSSDRVRTTIMNSRTKIFPKRVKARIEAGSILNMARRLSKLSDGVFVTGQGLVERYAFNQANLHVGIASWIKSEDIITEEALEARLDAIRARKTLNLCIAARLEPMKGVGLGLDALHALRKKCEVLPSLSIYGDGPDSDRLVALTKSLQLEDTVSFRGTVPYGKPFFDAVSQHDLMLLTNLNVEQPRVVFDSISQGTVPICPNSGAYTSLGLDPNCLNDVGDAESLAAAIARFFDKEVLAETVKKNLPLVREYTIDAMHMNRARWVQGVVDRTCVKRSDRA